MCTPTKKYHLLIAIVKRHQEFVVALKNIYLHVSVYLFITLEEKLNNIEKITVFDYAWAHTCTQSKQVHSLRYKIDPCKRRTFFTYSCLPIKHAGCNVKTRRALNSSVPPSIFYIVEKGKHAGKWPKSFSLIGRQEYLQFQSKNWIIDVLNSYTLFPKIVAQVQSQSRT